MSPSEEYLKAAVAVTKDVIARVRTTTVECDGCGLRRQGELLHGSRCDRCEMGTFRNVAFRQEGDRP